MTDQVTPHNPLWIQAFADEAAAITDALPGIPIALHHIGSTAIPGILAKPIIDILGAVPNLDVLAANSAALKAKLTSAQNPSWEAYLDGKAPFILATEQDALRWHRST